tara:strand:- start:4224 stop:6125 length:1902 start_codon:yes stop_codon:yes gene_type:complete
LILIKKIKLIKYILVLCVIFSCERNNTKPPNILWITVEDISPNLGCYGDNKAHTPTLDSLASIGFKYINAIANAPVCAPARNSIITGMYPSSLGTLDMRSSSKPWMKRAGWVPDGVLMYPEVLRSKGYYCTNNTKEDYNFDLNREIWDDSGKQAHWKNRPQKDTPFFSIFNLTMTHESCINSKQKHEQYTKELPKHLRIDPQDIDVPPYYPDTPVIRELLSRHYDNISTMDMVVSNLLQDLEDAGQSENTIIFFYSDHGTGLPRHKRWLFDTGVKVPLIVYIPEAYKHIYPSVPGSEINRLVSFIDLAPTVLNLANADIPSTMQGKAFLGKELNPESKYVHIARGRMDERYDMQRGVRTKDYKYLRYYEPSKPFIQFMNTPESSPLMTELRKAEKTGNLSTEAQQLVTSEKPEESLFDLKKDPFELNDLAKDPDYQLKLSELREVHNQWMLNILDVGLIPEAIIRDWEKSKNKPIYQILREDSSFYDDLLLISSSNNEKFLQNGLSHPNEAIRYQAAIGLHNMKFRVTNETISLLKKTLMEDQVINVSIAAGRALLRFGIKTKNILKKIAEGLAADNEWTRLQSALVADDFNYAISNLYSESKNLIKNDPNKYVVRVLNHALNVLNGTDNKVR